MNPNDEPAPGAGLDFASAMAGIVERHRDALAVADPAVRLTYGELDEWSDAMAATILDAVGTGEEPVLVLSGHDAAAVTAFVAVAKCARPVVMLDSTTPVARMRAVADGAAPVAVLHAPDMRTAAELIGPGAGRIIAMPPRPQPGASPVARVPLAPGAPLSIVFTSGSTGRPKGVIIGSVSFMTAVLAAGLAEGVDRVLCPVPLGFVFGLGLLVRALGTGGQLHLHDPRSLGVDGLAERLDAERITELGCTPFIVRALAATVAPGRVFESVNRVILGGEAVLTLDVGAVRGFTRTDCLVINQLGSTESWGIANHVVLPGAPLPDQHFLPVGAPSAGREVELIDDGGRVVTEPGRPGIIHVRGQHMSDGYWRDPESTAARFRTLEDGRTSYITGDVGRWNTDGQLEYVGRADNMVKIRGYLVEPAEVETHITAEGEVEDVVVVGRPSPRGDGTTALIAYVVPAARTWVSGAAIRRRLADELPGYMVPAQIVELPQLPRNPNGKVDRPRLPDPPAQPHPTPLQKYEYEEAIAEVAATALGLEAVGLDDDLFELGLDSLAVEEMVAVLDEQLNLRVSSATIMENPTPARLARLPRGNSEHLVDGILVPIVAGTGAPVFAFSGAGGLALSLRELALQVNSGRPVYGIQGRGLEGGGLPDLTIARMARRYLRTMRRLQPHGPYWIIGHSLGAVVAYDVARRLRDAGEEIAYLGLLDPPDATAVGGSAQLAGMMPPELSGISNATALGRTRILLSARYPFVTRSFWRRVKSRGRFHAFFEAAGSAVARYRVGAPLALSRAYLYLVERTPATAADLWFDPPAAVVRIPGEHLSMLRRPFVTELAAHVSEHLRESARAPARTPEHAPDDATP